MRATPNVHVNGCDAHYPQWDSDFMEGNLSVRRFHHTMYSHSREEERMKKVVEKAFAAEFALRNKLITTRESFVARLNNERGDVPGWVLVVLMTTGLVTAIWTIAAPRLTAILKNSLDSMNGIR